MEERDESRISLSGPTGPMADGSHLGPKASEAPADIQQVPLVRRSPYRTYLEIAREHRKIDDDKAVDALFHQKEPFVDLFVPKATVTKTFKAFLADAKYRDLRSGTLGDEIRATKSGIVVDYSMTEGRPLQSRSGNGLSATGSASNQVYQTRESQRCSDKNYDYDDDDEVDEDEDEDEEDSDTDACEEENDNLAIDTVEVFRRLSSPFGGWEETEEGGNVVARRVAYLAHFGRYQLLTLLTTTPIEFAIPYMWPLMYRYLTFENGFGVWPATPYPEWQQYCLYFQMCFYIIEESGTAHEDDRVCGNEDDKTCCTNRRVRKCKRLDAFERPREHGLGSEEKGGDYEEQRRRNDEEHGRGDSQQGRGGKQHGPCLWLYEAQHAFAVMGRTKHDQLAFFLLDNYYSRRSNSPSDKNEDNEEGAIYDRETPESYDKHEYPDEPDPCSHGTLAASGKGIGHPGHYFVAVLAVRLEEITTAWVDSVDKLGKASKRERDRAKEAIYRAHGPNSSQKAKKEVARSEMRQEVLEEIANKLDNGLRSFESTFFAEGKMKLFRDDPDSGNRGVDQWVSRIENCHKKLTLCRGTLKDTVIPAEEKFCSHLRNDASLQMQERAEAFNNIVRGQQSQMIAVSLAVVFSLPVSLTSGIFSMDGMPIARTWPAFVVVMIGFWILIMVFYGGHTKFPWLRDQLSGLWEGRRPTRKPGRPPDGD